MERNEENAIFRTEMEHSMSVVVNKKGEVCYVHKKTINEHVHTL